jgi:hypothetical protein
MPGHGSVQPRGVPPSSLVPREWVATAGSWPDGPLVEECPVLVTYVQAIALAVLTECRFCGWSARELAARAKLPEQAVRDAVDGASVPRFEVVVGMEAALGRSLWPRHGVS